jgi:hypothetical protein
VTVLDGPAAEIATWGMVTEAGHDAILGVRLKVDDEGLIDEIDMFVVRFNDMASAFSGLQTVLNPDADGFPGTFASSGGLGGLGLGVRAQIRTLAFRYIEGIRDRRFVAASSGGSRRSGLRSPTAGAPAVTQAAPVSSMIVASGPRSRK